MDTTDIGGAAARGVPPIPRPRTVAFSQDGMPYEVDGKGNPVSSDNKDGPADLRPGREVGEIDPNVQRATHATVANVAYPETHPGTRDDLDRTPTGALLLHSGDVLSEGPGNGEERPGRRPLYFDDAGSVTPAAAETAAQPTDDAQRREDILRELGELEAEREQQPATPPAANEAGTPLIEVVFDTPMGAIVSYYHEVVESGPWLVLITDNRRPAQQKFVPKVKYDENGNMDKTPIKLTITGKDREEHARLARPLNMTFTVGDYDMTVLGTVET